MKLGAGFLLLLVAAGAGWTYRGELQSLLGRSRAGADAQAPTTTVLYRWVDDKGVTHYEERPGKGQAVKVDGSNVTPLDPIGPGGFHQFKDSATEASQAPQTLHQLREELKAGAERMREGKIAAGF